MQLLIFKTLHVISVILWMGSILYLPRIFILLTEAQSLEDPEKGILTAQYKKMSKALMLKVAWPASILTIVFGLGMMHLYFSEVWFWVKIGFVLAFFVYHHLIHFANKKLQKDNYSKTVNQFKSMNLTGFVFLITIVSLSVLKSAINNLLIIGGSVAGLVLVFLLVRVIIIKKSASNKS